MQVEFYLAGEITQVINSIPWVRCASGNVYSDGRAHDAAMPHERMKIKLLLDQMHFKIFLIADCGMS